MKKLLIVLFVTAISLNSIFANNIKKFLIGESIMNSSNIINDLELLTGKFS